MSDAGTIEARRPSRALAAWQDFEGELRQREQAIATMLPRHVSKERFLSVAVSAVKQNPDLLTADTRSLFGAITKAAQDGLMPDGREGVISIYNTKIKGKNGQQDAWLKMAQWNPMVYGLRKRARELDDIIIDAQVVYENDDWDWDQGDNPHIIHKPAVLGKTRGKMLGSYAIFKKGDVILHREVMCEAEVEDVRKQSKAPDSLMWTKFKTEGWRKTVIRRGIKTVPVSESLEQVVRRDDELFEFGQTKVQDAITPPPAPSPPPAPKVITNAPAEAVNVLSEEVERQLDRAAIREMNGETSEPQDAQTEPDQLADWLSDMCKEAAKASTLTALDALDDQVCRELDGAGREDLRAIWNAAYTPRKAALTPKGKKS